MYLKYAKQIQQNEGSCVGEDLLFEDAVDAGWIAPTIYGWLESGYSAIDRLIPFGGYWINTSRPILVKVRPHLFDDGQLTRTADEVVATSTLELRARDISGEGVSDFIPLDYQTMRMISLCMVKMNMIFQGRRSNYNGW